MKIAKRIFQVIEVLLDHSSEDDLESLHHNLGDEARNQLDSIPKTEQASHRGALKRYNGFGSEHINQHLRHKAAISSSDGHCAHLMRNLTSNATNNSFHAYRGVSGTALGNLQPGSIIHDKGFTSTSLHHGIAHAFSKHSLDHQNYFRIHVIPGTKGHYLSGHDHYFEHQGEHEFILHPGTKFRVGETNHIAIDGKDHRITDLHIHSQDD